MDIIVSIVTWVTAIVTISSIIAASTPTPKDDIWIGKIYKLIDMLAINVGKAKDVASKK
tara:strand:- start:468 stop:644 length:177 start_codon:yes stop_codon:yes gene_type:complete